MVPDMEATLCWGKNVWRCIASKLARDEGWMAEHMLIMRIISSGQTVPRQPHFQRLRQTISMMQPTIEGWKVETIGDDIAWMKIGSDGRLYAINPEAGFWVAPERIIKPTPWQWRPSGKIRSSQTAC